MLARLAAVAFLAYFVSGERVVAQLAAARAGQPPVHVETSVASSASGAPSKLTLDLHPDYGMRAADDRGRRWVLQRGKLVAGSDSAQPAWLPDLELLALRDAGALHGWLSAHGIDPATNELARCGDGDCYVLGGRQAQAQLWVDKNALEARRVVLPGRPELDLDAWRAFEKVFFPTRVALGSAGSSVATLTVESVSAAPSLGPGDFTAAWVQAAGPARPE